MLAQSALLENPWITVFPLAMAPSMASRWEIDLSPGSSTRPWIRLEGLIVIFISGDGERSGLREGFGRKLGGIIQDGLERVKTGPSRECTSAY